MATVRKPVSKKARFEVFKRDGFVCQYCGSTPPRVVLEVDHVNAVANGGGNDLDNLVTACFDCNRGKGARELSVAPATVAEKAALLGEKREQLRAYNELLEDLRVDVESAVFTIEQEFVAGTGKHLLEKERDSIRNQFLPKLPEGELIDYMRKAVSKRGNPSQAWKYFCGICWNVIKEKGR